MAETQPHPVALEDDCLSPTLYRSTSTASTPTAGASIAAKAPSAAIGPQQPAQQISGSSIRPATASQPAPNTPTASAARVSVTSKVWVIPPRPKPGRKPATDTPPTKRKAQNRAAQRAFRERRAARVGELEEQIDEQREEHERSRKDLRATIHGLELELHSSRSQCVLLESLLDKERQDRIRVEAEAENLRRHRQNFAAGQDRSGRLSSTDNLPTAPKYSSTHFQPRPDNVGTPPVDGSAGRPSAQSLPISQIISLRVPLTREFDSEKCGSCLSGGPCACTKSAAAGSALGCGRCSTGTRCECLEEAFAGTGQPSELKRRLPSPSAYNGEKKRVKPILHDEPLEIDFTTTYSRQNGNGNSVPTLPSVYSEEPVSRSAMGSLGSLRDTCGFCKDGTYCVCADAHVAVPLTLSDSPPAYSQATRMPQQVQTPPAEVDPDLKAMEATSERTLKRPQVQCVPSKPNGATRRGGCGPNVNGPGTCAQCIADPKSGLFCRSLATRFERGTAGGGPDTDCCEGRNPDGGCCRTADVGSTPACPQSSGRSRLSLSCADTYKTLAGHRNFEQAASDIGSWLPKLKAMPSAAEDDGEVREDRTTGESLIGRPPRARRTPIEVEAASIMSVLKEFDVRFGRGI